MVPWVHLSPQPINVILIGAAVFCRAQYCDRPTDKPSDSVGINRPHLRICSATMLPNNEEELKQLECGPMPNVMAALPNIGGALCSTPQSLADAHCWSTVQ